MNKNLITYLALGMMQNELIWNKYKNTNKHNNFDYMAGKNKKRGKTKNKKRR